MRSSPRIQLHPVMALARGTDRPALVGVEARLGSSDSPDAGLEWVESVLTAVAHLPRTDKLLLGIGPSAFCRAGLGAELGEAVRRHGLHETEVIVVLSDERGAGDLAALERCAHPLRRYGFELALAAYGRGYSDLDAIYRLPLDYLKLDGSITEGIHRDRRRQAIVRSTVELGRELGISTIVEGVGSREELGAVQRAGARYVQGRFFPSLSPGSRLASSLQSIRGVRLESWVNGEPIEPPPTGLGPEATHELANLISGVALLADQTLARVAPGDPLYEDLRLIRAAGDRAVELTQELQLAEEGSAEQRHDGEGEPGVVPIARDAPGVG